MDQKVMEHLKFRKPSIEKIKIICDEAIEHDSSWWEFKDRVELLLKQETKLIKKFAK